MPGRIVFFAAVVAGILSAATSCAQAGGHDAAPREKTVRRDGSDWPRLLGPNGDGRSPETALRFDWSTDGPPVRWHVEIGEGYSAPSVAQGRVFVFDRAGDAARLRCLNAATGDELWHAEYPTGYEDMYGFSNGPRSAPVVDDDRVYTFGAEGRLRCHRVIDGELLWEVDTTARFGVVQNFFGVGSTPAVEGDLLIVPVGGSPPDSPRITSGEVRGNGSGIVAFDKGSGEVRYAVTDELASYSSPVIATVGGVRRGFAFMRGGLVAFRPGTGQVDFHFPWRARKLESVNASNPVVAGNLVMISESYGPATAVLRVTADGHEVVWQDPRRDPSLRTHWMTPVHHEGNVYASSGSGSGDAELRAVELATGKVRWREPGLGRSTLIYAARHLIVLTEHGRLLFVRATPDRYVPVSQVDLSRPNAAGFKLIRSPAWSPPALSRGYLFVRGKDRLLCLDLRSVSDEKR